MLFDELGQIQVRQVIKVKISGCVTPYMGWHRLKCTLNTSYIQILNKQDKLTNKYMKKQKTWLLNALGRGADGTVRPALCVFSEPVRFPSMCPLHTVGSECWHGFSYMALCVLIKAVLSLWPPTSSLSDSDWQAIMSSSPHTVGIPL